jgi:hypothetical protein
MNLKYILIIIILIVVLGGGFLVYQYGFKPSEGDKPFQESLPKDETANWLIYKNEEYKYEIRYPSNLEMTETFGLPPERLKMISWFFHDETSDIAKYIAIDIVENAGRRPLTSILGYDSAGCKIETEESTFARVSCETEFMQGVFSAFSRDDKVYVISFSMTSLESLSGKNLSYEINVYNQMLSTFRFLE